MLQLLHDAYFVEDVADVAHLQVDELARQSLARLGLRAPHHPAELASAQLFVHLVETVQGLIFASDDHVARLKRCLHLNWAQF